MPNARDIKHSQVPPKIFLMGDTGSGKTSQFLTLPGRKFIYLFDPNALLSLEGHDLDYEEFYPDVLPLNITPLAKDGRKDTSKLKDTGSDLYVKWEEHFEKRAESGFFDQYDWLGLDSFTTFSDMVMDRVLTLNGRSGQWPQQDDYGPQMNAISKVVRTATNLGCGLFCTGHTDVMQDDLTKRIYRLPLLTGRLRKKIPLLFSEVMYTEAAPDGKGGTDFTVMTKPDRMTGTIRVSVKGLAPVEKVNIDFSRSPIGQGIGKWYSFQRSNATPQPAAA
jgi:hypothetical protein